MAASQINTMAEVNQRLYETINQGKTVMDADLPYLVSLETQVLQKIRQPVTQMQQQGMLPPDGQPGAPPPMAPPQMPGQGQPSFGPGGGNGDPMAALRGGGGMSPGMTPGQGAPNADELRRLLQQR